MTKLEQFKKIVQEANPEIMELKFGCEVVRFTTDEIYKVVCTVGGHYLKLMEWSSDTINIVNTDSSWDGEIEILGRPIRLADVLLAMKEKYSVGRVGEKAYWYSTQEDITQGAYWKGWNLLNDNLDSQSPETLDFLYKIFDIK